MAERGARRARPLRWSRSLISAGIAAANRERQAFALDFFETWRGRQLFQTGHLPDAAAVLEGRFDPASGMPVAGALYAAGIVALGQVAIHTGDERHKRETAALARAMVADGTPANRAGTGGWLLALAAAAAAGNPGIVGAGVAAAHARGFFLAPTPTPHRSPRPACSSTQGPRPSPSLRRSRTWRSRSCGRARSGGVDTLGRALVRYTEGAKPGTRERGCEGDCGPTARGS